MIKKFYASAGVGLVLWLLSGVSDGATLMTPRAEGEKAPSREQVLWTETDIGYDLETEYSYVGRAKTDFGNGRAGKTSQHYGSIQQLATTRWLMACLLHTGLRWQWMSFSPSEAVLLPNQLSSLDAFLGTDFRWSEHHMVRLQVQPGLYTDFQDVDHRDINVPWAIAYTHIPSKRFQWALGLSVNPWRGARYVPGGGFRWYINKRWKLKMMLPEPQLEYRAADALHLSVGTDFRGETYRVGQHFGDDRGDASLNNALVDYQEIRVGVGFSWNIKPLIAFEGRTGYMLDRKFDFHNNGIHSSGPGAPYVSFSLRILFQLVKDARPIPAQIRAMQIEFPFLRQFLQLPK